MAKGTPDQNHSTTEQMEMQQDDRSTLMDQPELENAKKARSTKIMNAFLIGFAIGVLIYGVAKNNIGFFALVPLFIAYKFFNRPKPGDE